MSIRLAAPPQISLHAVRQRPQTVSELGGFVRVADQLLAVLLALVAFAPTASLAGAARKKLHRPCVGALANFPAAATPLGHLKRLYQPGGEPAEHVRRGPPHLGQSSGRGTAWEIPPSSVGRGEHWVRLADRNP